VSVVDRPHAAVIQPGELAELIASFSEVTGRLEATHRQLSDEVARLKAELGSANEQLERSRRLAALGEMAAGIAHEIRNPLGSIRLYARLLDEDLSERPEARATLAKIASSARVMDSIVGDVLSFARESRVRAGECDAGEIVSRAVESCSHEGVPGWGEGRVRRADLERGAVGVECDAGLVQQALVNVVRNAFEAVHEAASCGAAGPGDGHAVTVDVRERRGAISGRRGAACVVFSVRDTGPGVSGDVVRRMFNPFFTTRATGTGLGLAIVHRIVDAHGGRVSVRNNRDDARNGDDPRGATVELILPRRATGVENEPVANKPVESEPGETNRGEYQPGRPAAVGALHVEAVP